MRLGFPHNWRLLLKYAGIIAAGSFLLFGLVSWILFRQRNALVLEQIHSSLDKAQSGQLIIGSIDLRFFRSFPDISIEIDSVYYYERRDSLRGHGEQPIIQADQIYVALELWPLFNNRVEVTEISVSSGRLNLVEYAKGVYNIHRALEKPRPLSVPIVVDTTRVKPPVKNKPKPLPPKQKPTPSEDLISIALENVSFQDVAVSWLPLGARDRNSLLVRELEAGLSQTGTVLEIDLDSRYNIDTLLVGKYRMPQGEVQFGAEATFDMKDNRLVVHHTNLVLDVFSFAGSGTYEHNNQGMLDFQVKATTEDLPLIEKLLRPETIRNNSDLLRSGDFYIDGKVYGPVRQKSPQFDFTFGVRDLSFKLPGNSGSFKNLGFEGSLASGSAPDYSQAILYLKQIKGEMPGGSIDGDVRISNLNSPWLQCTLQTNFALDGFDQAFQINSVKDLRGFAGLRLRFDGPMQMPWPGNSGPKATFDADFSLSNLSFLVAGSTQRFGDINCKGTFNSGSNPDQSEAMLAIPELKAVIPGGQILGSLRITNLNQPFIHYRLLAGVDLAGYDKALQLKKVSNLRGRASAEMRFDGPLALIGTHAMDSSRSSTLKLDSVSFELPQSKKVVKQLQASLINQNNAVGITLDFQTEKSDVHATASIENLMHRIFARERIMQASGKVTSKQFVTQDFVFDTLRAPIVNDRISNFSMEFNLQNGLNRTDSLFENLEFDFGIKNLVGSLDKLPDIRKLDADGTFRKNERGVSVELNQFHLLTPQGRADVSGDVNLPGNRQLDARARLELTDFPWQYIHDLIAEIRDGVEPTHKNLQPGESDVVTANLDLSASLRTYPFDFHQLEIRNSRFMFTPVDKKAFGANRIDAALRPFTFLHPPGSGAIVGIKRVQGNVGLKGSQVPGISDVNASLTVDGTMDSLHIGFLRSSMRTESDKGSIALNLAPSEPTLHLHYEVIGALAEDIVSKFSKNQFLKGAISYTIDLSTRGKSWTSAQQNLAGTMDIRSDSLQLYGIDIDDALTKFEKSQKFNLTDLGAVMLVGPVGIVATKGTDFVALATINVNNREKTHIQQLLAQWKLDDQVLQTTDVAFATLKNRVAFTGSIDFAHDSIPGIEVAVVDKNGCSLMDQKLYGKFSAIQTGKLNVAKTLLGSVINFVDALVGKDCKPVYTGQVKDPRTKQR